MRLRPARARLAGFALALLCVPPAAAQVLPDRPLTWAGGRVVMTADVSVGTATSEKDNAFNPGAYGEDTMRLVQAGVVWSVYTCAWLYAQADLRVAGEPTSSDWYFQPRRAVLTLRPRGTSALTVSGGFLQPAFGPPGDYGRRNLLIGRPLVYQYPTALRADAVPWEPGEAPSLQDGAGDESYATGTYRDYSGLPLADPTGWNAGLEVRVGGDRLRSTATLANGSLSNPHSRGSSGGWQGALRLEGRPAVGLLLGASAAYGPYLDRERSGVMTSAAGNQGLRERALGFDVEYSRDYWVLRAEALHSRRTVPVLRATLRLEPLPATGIDVEARYRLAPGLYAAARVGYLSFGDLPTLQGSSWDANVARIEAGTGWSLARGLLLKTTYQFNRRDMADPFRSAHRLGVEALAWF